MIKILIKAYSGYCDLVSEWLDKVIENIDPKRIKERNEFYAKCLKMGFTFVQAERMWNYCFGYLNQEEFLDSLFTGIFRQSPLLLDCLGLSYRDIKEAIKPFKKIKTGYCDFLESNYETEYYEQDDYTNTILDLLEKK